MQLEVASGIHIITKAVFYILSVSCHIDSCILFMLQDVSNWEEGNILTIATVDKHSNFFVYAWFLCPTKSSECRSVPFYSRILLILYSVFWICNDSDKAIRINERQDTVLLCIIRVMLRIFIIVSIVSVVILVALVIIEFATNAIGCKEEQGIGKIIILSI